MFFVAKYSSAGNILWARQSLGASSANYAYAAATDNIGNVYLTGIFDGTLQFGSYTITNIASPEPFLVKYSPNGIALWARNPTRPGTGDWDYACSVATDKTGNVYITGYYGSPTLTFGSTVLTNNGIVNIFLAKYNSNGTVIWAKNFGGVNHDYGFGVCVDKNDNIYLTGNYTSSSIAFGSFPLNSPNEFFLTKLDTNGDVKWAKSAGSDSSVVQGMSVTNDIGGYIYITGYYYPTGYSSDTISFGPYSLYPSGSVFITKYDSSGNVLWAEQDRCSNNSGFEESYSVVVDSSKNVYISGGAGGYAGADTLSFGSVSLPPPLNPGDPAFVMEFDSTGKPLCGTAIASGGYHQNSISIDSRGLIYFGSDDHFDAMTLGPDTISGNEQNPFVAQWKSCTNKSDAGIYQLSHRIEGLNVFPNPSTGQFTLSLSNVPDSYRDEKCNVEVYNELEERVYSSGPLQTPKGALIAVNIGNQPNGIYLYRVITENGSLVGEGKVVIQK